MVTFRARLILKSDIQFQLEKAAQKVNWSGDLIADYQKGFQIQFLLIKQTAMNDVSTVWTVDHQSLINENVFFEQVGINNWIILSHLGMWLFDMPSVRGMISQLKRSSSDWKWRRPFVNNVRAD